MTRRDYIDLALALRNTKPQHSEALRDQWLNDCDAIASVLDQSSGFDRDLFLKNCGIESVVKVQS